VVTKRITRLEERVRTRLIVRSTRGLALTTAGERLLPRFLRVVLFGTTWPFESPKGGLSVEVRSRFHANDGRVVLEAARRGLGLAALPRYLVDDDLREGKLVPLLKEFPLATSWLKALVPRMKMDKPAVRELVTFLKMRMQPVAPWEAQAAVDSQ
jgi:DNA-binding transcriptional LysR family regulator